VELISVTKQFGFGLNVLGQNSRQKSVRRGQGTTQIGSGTWMNPENLWQILQEKMRAKIEASIPNKKKLPYTLLVRPYRELILESLMEGKDIDLIFDASVWSCSAYAPVSQLIYAALRSKAKGLFPPSEECRRLGL
jgi:hypothetical protein